MAVVGVTEAVIFVVMDVVAGAVVGLCACLCYFVFERT